MSPRELSEANTIYFEAESQLQLLHDIWAWTTTMTVSWKLRLSILSINLDHSEGTETATVTYEELP
jgi:hypothetical protein